MTATLRGIAAHPRELQAALTQTTERLAHELAHPTPKAPEWSDFEWSIAKAVAAMHGVSPLLSRALRWRGPEGWMQFLEEQRVHVTQRHARIENLLRQIDQAAREAGIAIIALKGVALHALGLYTRGERPMADVDLLVHAQDAARAVCLIESLRFRECRRNWRERAFAPLESHSAGPLGEHGYHRYRLSPTAAGRLERLSIASRVDESSTIAHGRCDEREVGASRSAE
jgi:hypothetical protein